MLAGVNASALQRRSAGHSMHHAVVLSARIVLMAAAAPASCMSSGVPRAYFVQGCGVGVWHLSRGSARIPILRHLSQGFILTLRGGDSATSSEHSKTMAEGPEPSGKVTTSGPGQCVARDHEPWSEMLNVSALIHGPYDPEPEPNPLGDSSSTLSDVSSDPFFPEAEQRQLRQMLKQHDAHHGPPEIDRYVGVTYPVLERILHKSGYRSYWRPGIINKRLWAAAETGDDQDIMFAVAYLNADVNAVDLNIYNYTALFWAAMNGHHTTAELLIRLGARVNATDIYGSSALHYATDRGWPKVVEVLADCGIHAWHRNSFGRTALDWAMEFVCTYDAARTPIEDKFRLVTNRIVYKDGSGEPPFIAGCNWETLWALRRVMGLPPLDKPHRTGQLEDYRQWARRYRKKVQQRRQQPRTVFDMAPLLPDGTAFDDGIVLDRLPRKFSSPFYRTPGRPHVSCRPGRAGCVHGLPCRPDRFHKVCEVAEDRREGRRLQLGRGKEGGRKRVLFRHAETLRHTAAENPKPAIWPKGYPAANKQALDAGFREPPYPYIHKNSMLPRPWMLSETRPGARAGGSRIGGSTSGDEPIDAPRKQGPDGSPNVPPPPPSTPPRPSLPLTGPSAPPPPPRPPKPPPPSRAPAERDSLE